MEKPLKKSYSLIVNGLLTERERGAIVHQLQHGSPITVEAIAIVDQHERCVSPKMEVIITVWEKPDAMV